MAENKTILTVENISKTYTGKHTFKALDDVSFDLMESETLGVVGESGSGKTTIAKIIAGIFKASEGTMTYNGAPLEFKRPQEIRKQIQYIYQEPVAALDPAMTIEKILREPLKLYYGLSNAECRDKITELLEEVGLDPAQVRTSHPRQLSGGQCQRIGIARALAGDPRIIICDEPTSALDATIQAQILELMLKLKEEKKFSYIFITHNLGVVKKMSDRIIVMQKGKIVEQSDVNALFEDPQHEYTKTLLASVPKVDIPYYGTEA